MTLFMGNSLWQLIAHSDTITWCVFFVLLTMSIACWAVFIGKMIVLRMKRKQISEMLGALKEARSIEDVAALASQRSCTMPGYFLSKNILFLKALLESRRADYSHERARHEWEMMQCNIERTLDAVIVQEESYLPILSTSAAVATLLGLFGTVWGLIHSFMSISEKQVADITTVAPGIAEALTTTLIGLLVAIPALVMYNVAMSYVRDLENKLVAIADKISFIFQHVLVP